MQPAGWDAIIQSPEQGQSEPQGNDESQGSAGVTGQDRPSPVSSGLALGSPRPPLSRKGHGDFWGIRARQPDHHHLLMLQAECVSAAPGLLQPGGDGSQMPTHSGNEMCLVICARSGQGLEHELTHPWR